MAAPTQPSTRMTALQNLQKQLPVANQRVAQGMQAARDMQIQQAVASAPVGGTIAPTAQQTAAAATAQTGQAQVEQAKQMVQQAGQVGQLQLGEQRMGAQQQVAQAQQAARQQEITNAERLGKLDLSAKQELYDKELQFKKDEAGRTLFNERQLADYAIRSAKSDEEYRNYAQKAELLSRRKMQAMETAFKLVEEDLKAKWDLAEQKKDQATKQKIYEIRKGIEEKMKRERNRAANRSAMWQTGGVIVGAAAGALIAGPGGYAAGASVGAQVGGAVGGMAASQTEE